LFGRPIDAALVEIDGVQTMVSSRSAGPKAD
jgi:hypothetical protein